MDSAATLLYLSSSSEDDDDDHASVQALCNSNLKRSRSWQMVDVDDDLMIVERPAELKVRSSRDRVRSVRSSVVVVDDDDCCILDNDPDASATGSAVAVGADFDSDELVMTGETGPVACRDFPHARHLCVHFPFKTSLHVKYCTQCHCYVCDKQAPCFEWGDGNQWGDHCHASDKDAKWIALRKLTKSLPPPQPRPPPPMSTLVTSTGLGSLWATSGDRSQTATIAAPVVPTFSDGVNQNQVNVSVAPQPSILPSGTSRRLPATLSSSDSRKRCFPQERRTRGKGSHSKFSKSLHAAVKASQVYSNEGFQEYSYLTRSYSMPVGRYAGEGLHIPPSLEPSRQSLQGTTVACPPLNPSLAPGLLSSDGFHGNSALESGVPNADSHMVVQRTLGRHYVTGSARIDQQVGNVQIPPLYTSYSPVSSSVTDPYAIPGSGNMDQQFVHHTDTPCFQRPNEPPVNLGNIDILARPPQGWTVDAASSFEEFHSGLGMLHGTVDEGQEASVSLQDVLEQLGSDELWTDFPDVRF
ncbi:unnamed protein product [Sphagnum troendelagicum]